MKEILRRDGEKKIPKGNKIGKKVNVLTTNSGAEKSEQERNWVKSLNTYSWIMKNALEFTFNYLYIASVVIATCVHKKTYFLLIESNDGIKIKFKELIEIVR